MAEPGSGAGEPPNNFFEEFQRQLEEISERLEDIEESIEGDERGRWRGLRDEVRAIHEEQRNHKRLLDAWQRDQEVREAVEQRRKRFTTLAVSALSGVSVLLSILVAINTLTGGFGP